MHKCVCVSLCAFAELIKDSQQTSVTSVFFVHFLTTDESWRGVGEAVEKHVN